MDVSSRGGRAKREEGSNHEMLTDRRCWNVFRIYSIVKVKIFKDVRCKLFQNTIRVYHFCFRGLWYLCFKSSRSNSTFLWLPSCHQLITHLMLPNSLSASSHKLSSYPPITSLLLFAFGNFCLFSFCLPPSVQHSFDRPVINQELSFQRAAAASWSRNVYHGFLQIWKYLIVALITEL